AHPGEGLRQPAFVFQGAVRLPLGKIEIRAGVSRSDRDRLVQPARAARADAGASHDYRQVRKGDGGLGEVDGLTVAAIHRGGMRTALSEYRHAKLHTGFIKRKNHWIRWRESGGREEGEAGHAPFSDGLF